MIGFSLPVEIWVDGEDDARHRTAILSLDVDAEKPTMDLRLANDTIIVNAAVRDVVAAVSAIEQQVYSWQNERAKVSADG